MSLHSLQIWTRLLKGKLHVNSNSVEQCRPSYNASKQPKREKRQKRERKTATTSLCKNLVWLSFRLSSFSWIISGETETLDQKHLCSLRQNEWANVLLNDQSRCFSSGSHSTVPKSACQRRPHTSPPVRGLPTVKGPGKRYFPPPSRAAWRHI